MEKPLHVRVAEALGWTECSPYAIGSEAGSWGWHGREPMLVKLGVPNPRMTIPRFDADWAATGPLIDQFGIEVWKDSDDDSDPRYLWAASQSGYKTSELGRGPKPLLAVSALIVTLHEAGKL